MRRIPEGKKLKGSLFDTFATLEQSTMIMASEGLKYEKGGMRAATKVKSSTNLHFKFNITFAYSFVSLAT